MNIRRSIRKIIEEALSKKNFFYFESLNKQHQVNEIYFDEFGNSLPLPLEPDIHQIK